MPIVTWDHVHLRSPDPEATAAWLEDVLGGVIIRGPNRIECSARLRKGDPMGWFEHGSTIVVLAPEGFALAPGIADGQRIRAGAPLLRLPAG